MLDLIGDLRVSRETMDRLRAFEALTRKWSKTINLVSKDTQTDIWHRHILDSAQLFALPIGHPGPWLDIGSGGGFPGIVAAIMLDDLAAQHPITLVESDQRKATFLRTALRETGTSGTVIAGRVEDIPPHGATTLTARALAPVSDLLAHATRHLAENGTALLHKGRNHAEELDAAREKWSFEVKTHTSLTAPDAAILEIRNIQSAIA